MHFIININFKVKHKIILSIFFKVIKCITLLYALWVLSEKDNENELELQICLLVHFYGASYRYDVSGIYVI